MTIEELKVWANDKPNHGDQTYVGPNITKADVKGAVCDLFDLITILQDGLEDAQGQIRVAIDHLERIYDTA